MSNLLKQYFTFEHLPPKLAAVSKPFTELAEKLDETLPDCPEKTVAFRKLLEAKDCAVRAVIWKDAA